MLAMFTSEGDLNPPNNKKILWGVIMAVLAVGLLMAGGLKPLQTISLAAAFPFIFIMLFAGAALVKQLKKDDKKRRKEVRAVIKISIAENSFGVSGRGCFFYGKYFSFSFD